MYTSMYDNNDSQYVYTYIGICTYIHFLEIVSPLVLL